MTYASALVTGATGFVGSVLVRRLLAEGCRVFAAVRPEKVVPPGVVSINVDLQSPSAIRTALAGTTFDVVFHLAAYGVAPTDRDSDTMAAMNIVATGAFAEAAARAGARALVYTGTCSEYAVAIAGKPIGEAHPLGRSGTYGASKAAGGLWGSAVARAFGLPFCWLRLFGVYGPGEAPHRLVPYLVSRLRRNQSVDLTPGEQVRDLMFVDDVVEGLFLAASAAIGAEEGPLNLCTGQPVTVAAVARTVADILGKPHDMLALGARPYRPDEPMWLVGDPSRFRALTGHAPRVALTDGLERAISAA